LNRELRRRDQETPVNGRISTTVAAGKGLGKRAMWRNLAETVRDLQRTYGDAFNPYRPELHYMRGPGPAWHAKRTDATSTTPVVASAPARREIAQTHA
jgi:hypothetical protein